MTITRTGGGLFDLIGFDMVISWYSAATAAAVLVNGVCLNIDTTLSTYTLNLLDVSSVTISGLSSPDSCLQDDDGWLQDEEGGFFVLDDIEYEPAAVVPVPAALPLMLLALGGLGLAARRR
jgi:hypothetical protein